MTYKSDELRAFEEKHKIYNELMDLISRGKRLRAWRWKNGRSDGANVTFEANQPYDYPEALSFQVPADSLCDLLLEAFQKEAESFAKRLGIPDFDWSRLTK